jgi:hypothetical protein
MVDYQEGIRHLSEEKMSDTFLYRLRKGAMEIVIFEAIHLGPREYFEAGNTFIEKMEEDSFFFIEGFDLRGLFEYETKSAKEDEIREFFIEICQMAEKVPNKSRQKDGASGRKENLRPNRNFVTADVKAAEFMGWCAKEEFDPDDEEKIVRLINKCVVRMRSEKIIDMISESIPSTGFSRFVLIYGQSHAYDFLSLLQEKGWEFESKEVFYKGEE